MVAYILSETDKRQPGLSQWSPLAVFLGAALLAGCPPQAVAPGPTGPSGPVTTVGGERLRNVLQGEDSRLSTKINAEIQARGGKADDERANAIKTELKLPANSVALCGTTLCRLETTHANDAAYREYVRKTFIGFDAPFQGPFTVVTAVPSSTEPNGAPVKGVIFIGANTRVKFAPPVNDDCGGCAGTVRK